MKYNPAAQPLGAAKWALLMSAVGFAYALITSVSPSASANATNALPRALATNCVRLPTEFVTTSDLGATVVGTQFTRQILVRFGFRPHTFTFGALANGNGVITTSSSGKIQGMLTNPGADTFQINVTDATIGVPSPPISQVFTIQGVAQQYSEAPLHFETGTPIVFGTQSQNITLPTAVAGDVYFYSFAGNGGVPPYKYTVIAQGSQRFVPQGLAFDSKNGLLYGKPVVPTPAGSPAMIHVLLQDATGSQITGNFSLNIIAGTISSQAVATGGSMQLNFGNDNLFDSLSLTLILDKSELNAMGIRSKFDLNGLPLELNFGGFKLPPDKQPRNTKPNPNVFNADGVISKATIRPTLGEVIGTNVKDAIYTIRLNPKTGVLTAQFRNLDMIRTIGANFNSFEGTQDATNRGPIIPINIRLGLTVDADLTTSGADVLEKTDIVKFVYKRNGSIGRGTARLNDNLAPGGIFLINKITGTEAQVLIDAAQNIKEDRLFLQMKGLMRQPGAQPVIPATGDSVSVFINRLCLGMFPASSFAVNGDLLVFSNDDPSKGLKDLIIDNKKGTVLITTHGIAAGDDLFGSDILIAGEPQTVPITLTIGGGDPHNPTFDGQSTVTLFRRGKAITNR